MHQCRVKVIKNTFSLPLEALSQTAHHIVSIVQITGDNKPMTITLYDLCGADENKRFSPTCWRTKLTLVHKGLDFEPVGVAFTKIPETVKGPVKTLPTIVDGNDEVTDSFDIAVYLEKKYPDAPSLFGGENGVALAKFVRAWTNTTLNPLIAGLIVKDICDVLAEPDQKYFRETREAMFKKTLEEVQAGRDGRIEGFRAALTPLRTMLNDQPFIGGDRPLFADYIVFGSLKWLASLASFEVFASDDPVKAWFERIDAMYSGV